MNQEDRLEQKLLSIYSMVYDLQKFAETKNAAIFTLSAAAITAIFSFLASTYKILPFPWKIGLVTASVLFGISALLSIVSSLPARRGQYPRYGDPFDDDNFFYFGDLCKYSPNELVESIIKHYLPDTPYHRSHVDLADQIINHARITKRKFDFARRAVWFIFAASCSLLGVPILIYLIQWLAQGGALV